MMNGNNSSPMKTWLYYYLVTLLMVMVLNALFFPSVLEKQVREIGYDEFLRMVDGGQVANVAMDGNKIVFTEKGSENRIYKTGIWPDPNLGERLKNAGVSFSAEIPKVNTPLQNFIISWVIPILIFVGLGQLASRYMLKRMGGNAMTFGKANAKIYAETSTGKSFEDVAGQEEAKEALTEIVDFLHNPSRYTQIGATIPKGALLVGPPGTGKTLLAKAVAGEAKVPFFSISGSEFVEMFVGMGAAKVRDLFKQANDKAPCIVFIDEVDTIGKKRDGAGIGGNDEREQTLNQLLSEMDGFDGHKGVVILAATNRPESLDPALLRPGRFDRRIPVELPDLKGRDAILRVHAKNIKIADNLDLTAIARLTPGASGAELANIVNEAALRAVRLGKSRADQSDFEESVEVVIAGYQRKNTILSPHDKEIVAYHEIGHAVVAASQTDSAPVTKITIIPRTSGALGYTMQVEEEESFLMSKEQIENKIATLTAGRAAEELIFGRVTTGASDDIEKATRLARAMVSRFGMSDQFGMVALETVSNKYLGGDATLAAADTTAAKIDEEVISIVRKAHERAAAILRDKRDKLQALARYLMDKETITGAEFMEIYSK